LITAQDIAIRHPAPPMRAAAMPAPAVAFRERLLLIVLYVTVLASSVAFIEPSPHDVLMGVLAVACLIVGVRFERHIALLFLVLLIWNFAGLLSLLNVPGQEHTVQYAGTSIYLALAGVLFATLFAHNTMPRLAAMRAAYILTAVAASLEAVAGYFHLLPGSSIFLAMDRGAGTFKDPNVFGPFLIWPILIVLYRVIARRLTLLDLSILVILAIGVFLSFSRGAWLHTAVSGFVLLVLLLLSTSDTRIRLRLVTVTTICLAGVALVIVALLSLDSVSQMFDARAQAIQYYDVGAGGRFRLQELALNAILDFPNGMGPFEFARVHGVQQHNVYLQAFMVYGWIGGVSYLFLLITTLWIGLRNVFIAMPWQPYLITALAAFAGEIVEGFVIDSDHWRHFYLLLGLIWGLSIATMNAMQRGTPVPANWGRMPNARGY
jgi:hypothetical protein